MLNEAPSAARELNEGCLCTTLQGDLLAPQLRGHAPAPGPATAKLFSPTPVFISYADFETIGRSVAALHRAALLPGHVDEALARSPAIAALDFGPPGAFMGYDFHIGAQGPRLIEINTNAGGAFLHAAALRAHRACCRPFDAMFRFPADPVALDAEWIATFRAEWSRQRNEAPMRSVAIVDDDPASQFLAPEFELARALFLSHGFHAVVADAAQLEWRDGRLWHAALPAGVPVDLVYNRTTDFYLEEPRHAALREAFEAGGVVLTPHPRAHALHADKRNLVGFGDAMRLRAWGAAEGDTALLQQVVPQTQRVTAGAAEGLWAARRELFFKPAGGFGSRAAYRGEKLTRRVWGEILAGDYVAQSFVAPSGRMVDVDGTPTRLKLDVRAYAYEGRVQLLAARTYAGQTTNFRTPGGGFSPVVVLPT